MKVCVDTIVKLYCGAYQTNTVRGQRASCTEGPDGAARALGLKLFGADFNYVQQVASNVAGDTSITVWRIFSCVSVRKGRP